jgi:hypothetical protein
VLTSPAECETRRLVESRHGLVSGLLCKAGATEDRTQLLVWGLKNGAAQRDAWKTAGGCTARE